MGHRRLVWTAAVQIAIMVCVACNDGAPPEPLEQGQFPILDGDETFAFAAVAKVITYRGMLVGDGICTGTLVTPSHILTAAHCCHRCNPENLRCTSNPRYEVSIYADSTTYDVFDVEDAFFEDADSDYNEYSYYDDICILQLASEVPSTLAEPMKLWPDVIKYLNGAELIRIGFGCDQDTDGSYTTPECTGDGTKRIAPETDYIDTTYLNYDDRAAFKMRGIGPYKGDSGGPGIYRVDGRDYIAGIVHGHYAVSCPQSYYTAVAGANYDYIISILGASYVADSDEDGIMDSADNCPARYNPPPPDELQADGDGDGRGDACDICDSTPPGEEDLDSDYFHWIDDCGDHHRSKFPDGIADICGSTADTCPYTYNPSQVDRDGDGLGDLCDLCSDQNPLDICCDVTAGCPLPLRAGDCHYTDIYQDRMDRHDGLNLRDVNDPDGDGIGILCDNCPTVPNVEQINCNVNWEYRTREGIPAVPEADVLGDACDPESCTRVRWLQENIERTDDADGDDIPESFVKETFCAGIGTYEHSADISIRNVGISPLMVGAYSTRDVENAFCDCEGEGNTLQCMSIHCPDLGRVDGARWTYLLRQNETGTERGPVEETFLRSFDFPGYPVERDCRDDDYWGCEAGDDEAFAEFLVDGIGKDTLTWSWWDETRFGCSGDPLCSKQARLFFKPIVSGWPLEKNNTYHPEYDPSTFRVSTLHLGDTCSEIWIPPQRLSKWIGRYAPWWEDLVAAPPEVQRRPEVYVIEGFTEGCPPADVGQWHYGTVKPTSALRGLLISRFDMTDGEFSGFYPSVFPTADDILDTVDFAAVQLLKTEGLPHDDVIGGGRAVPHLWVFGGKDLDGPRNDLWHAVLTYPGQVPVFQWEIVEPALSIQPPALSGSAMFYDEAGERLIVWGGEGHSGPVVGLYVYDIENGTWSMGQVSGDLPGALAGFASAQVGETGYLWGGVDESGRGTDSLFTFDIQSQRFSRVPMEGSGPPPLVGATLWVDPWTHTVYLFGGTDGTSYHNWLWSWQDGQGSWKLVVDDCTTGTCPYPSFDPVLMTNDRLGMRAVLPGSDATAAVPSHYSEHYFLGRGSSWIGGNQLSSGIDERADCDGDGVREPDWGLRCSANWWEQPGHLVCDTLSGGTSCDQTSWTPERVFHRSAHSATDFDVEGYVLLVTRGEVLVSLDVTDPEAPAILDTLDVGGEARDLDISADLAAVAAGKHIEIVDVSDPTSLDELSQFGGCGTVRSVEVVGNRIYHLTHLGIGETDISDPANPILLRFAWVLPSCGDEWNVIDLDPTICEILSAGEEAHCGSIPGCLAGERRPLDVYGDRAYVGFFRNLLVVELDDPSGFTVSGAIRLDQPLQSIRFDDGLVYVNLMGGDTPVLDASSLAGPFLIGDHDVRPWVSGVQYEWGRTFALHHNRFHVAMLW